MPDEKIACDVLLTLHESSPSKQPESRRMHSKSSRYMGVTRLNKAQNKFKWKAQISRPNHICLYLGRFQSERDAAIAYDNAALLLRGPNAKCNFLN